MPFPTILSVALQVQLNPYNEAKIFSLCFTLGGAKRQAERCETLNVQRLCANVHATDIARLPLDPASRLGNG